MSGACVTSDEAESPSVSVAPATAVTRQHPTFAGGTL